MEYERKGVSITWQLEKVKLHRDQVIRIYSPAITVDVLDGTRWKLGIDLLPKKFWLTIKRDVEDKGPETIKLHYEFFISSIRSSRGSSFQFKKGQICPKISWRGRHKFSTSDDVTIRCKIWREGDSISRNGNFFLQTRIMTERCLFVGVVENFKNFLEVGTKTLKTISSPTGEELMTVNLNLFRSAYSYPYQTNHLEIEIIPLDNQTERFFDFRLYVLDSSGNKSETNKLERRFTSKLPVTYMLLDASIENLIKDSDLFLPNDTLSLHCEITFYSEKEYEKVEIIEYETNSTAEVKHTDFKSAVEVMIAKRGIPCDTKLQTATETFSAHTGILSGKSPVFEAMFKSNMKEAVQKCVRIDDVEPETVQRMLVFLYSGTLEELEWKEAMKLYVAADKYQILDLKQKCSVSICRTASSCYF